MNIGQQNIGRQIVDNATRLTLKRALAVIQTAKETGEVSEECVALVTACVALGMSEPLPFEKSADNGSVTFEKPYVNKDLQGKYPDGTWPHFLLKLTQFVSESAPHRGFQNFILRSVSNAIGRELFAIETSIAERETPTEEWLREQFPLMVERCAMFEAKSPIREACATMVRMLTKAGYREALMYAEYGQLIEVLKNEMIGAFAAKHQGRCNNDMVEEIEKFLQDMQLLCMKSITSDEDEVSFGKIETSHDILIPNEEPAKTQQAASNNSTASTDDDEESSTPKSGKKKRTHRQSAAQETRRYTGDHDRHCPDREGCSVSRAMHA